MLPRNRDRRFIIMTLCVFHLLRIAYFGLLSVMVENIEVSDGLFAYKQWNSEMLTFEIEIIKAENGLVGGFFVRFRAYVPFGVAKEAL